MRSYVDEYSEFYDETEFKIFNAVEDILEEIIRDMQAYDKNLARRDKFFNTLDSVAGQTFLFVIAIICIGECMISKYGRIVNGRYLEYVLRAKKIISSEIAEVYKSMHRGEFTPEEANAIFRDLIENKIQDLIQFDSELYQEIKFEEDLHRMCTPESLQKFIFDNVENVRLKITKAPRLIGLFEV